MSNIEVTPFFKRDNIIIFFEESLLSILYRLEIISLKFVNINLEGLYPCRILNALTMPLNFRDGMPLKAHDSICHKD